jgi:type VI secretion system secreted protein Hcp
MATAGVSNVQIYMQVKANGSEVKGSSVDTKNHDGWCDVIGMQYGLARATDRTNNQATGKAYQEAFTVYKPTDKATPLLFKAMTDNDTIDVVLKYYRDDPKDGKRKHFFSIELTKGRITGFQTEASVKEGAGSTNPYVDRLEFVGTEIKLVHVDGGLEGIYNAVETA